MLYIPFVEITNIYIYIYISSQVNWSQVLKNAYIINYEIENSSTGKHTSICFFFFPFSFHFSFLTEFPNLNIEEAIISTEMTNILFLGLILTY